MHSRQKMEVLAWRLRFLAEVYGMLTRSMTRATVTRAAIKTYDSGMPFNIFFDEEILWFNSLGLSWNFKTYI